jgi:hypothetical protein
VDPPATSAETLSRTEEAEINGSQSPDIQLYYGDEKDEMKLLISTVDKAPSRSSGLPRTSSPTSEMIKNRDTIETEMFKDEFTKLTNKVLDIIESYGQHTGESASAAGSIWIGRTKFTPRVESFIRNLEPVKMFLPSFPWKSVIFHLMALN